MIYPYMITPDDGGWNRNIMKPSEALPPVMRSGWGRTTPGIDLGYPETDRAHTVS